MRILLMLICCASVSKVAQQSIRDVDWRNFSYPMAVEGVPAEVYWMSSKAMTETTTLVSGKYVEPDCSDDPRSCPLITFDSVQYGDLAGIESTVAVVVLTYHSGGTASWQYMYLFTFRSSKPQLLAWLRTGSRADQGLRQVSITHGDLVLVVNDPDRRQGDCCSAGTITTHYRWLRDSFSAIGSPITKADSPSFDCKKAATPIERMVCQDAELSFLDRQMARSYKQVFEDASLERKEVIRRQQAAWFSEYLRACNAPLSDTQRRECIDNHLSERLITVWK